MSRRAAFAAAREFPLDDFQRRAFDALDAGHSVLVAAPTGSGKTLVAEYAIEGALDKGAKVFYPTPLKALSNQKYGDFVRELGAERVGLLTGDNSINGEAPIVVMTTEVLRNMIYAASPTLHGLHTVVLDEVHYLQDRYRGAVWEEVIVHLAPEIDLVCLSATVSNAEEFAEWIGTVRGTTTAIIEEHRPVQLRHRYLVADRATDRLELLPTFAPTDRDDDELRPNPEVVRLEQRPGHRQLKAESGRGRGPSRGHGSGRGSGPGSQSGRRGRSPLRPPSRAETVELLHDQGMLPAILFVFSRAGCDQGVDACRAASIRLTTEDEAQQIRSIAEAHTAGLDPRDLAILGYGPWLASLEAGCAAHHAGVVPPMKEAVEEAFAAGLVKVVFATETLALGINMPARTVVIEKITKFTGERHDFLTPGEYTQLTGRAGRRGIDDVGYAVVCWSPWVTFEQVASLASRRTDALRSSFRPNYNMAVNLVRRYQPDVAHHLLNLSFAQFNTDREVVTFERELERARGRAARARIEAADGEGDIDEYRQLVAVLDRERSAHGWPRQVARALERLVPGDVLWVGRRGGKVVVLSHDNHRGTPHLLALSASKRLVRLGADDFRDAPEPLARMALPSPYAPRSRAFQQAALESLRRVKVRPPGRRTGPDDATLDHVTRSVEAHPVARDPHREVRVRAAANAERFELEAQRLERRVHGRTESLAHQLDRVLALLSAWGYVDGWSLTPAGTTLARVYAETDLLLAESLREGLLDGLSPAETAAIASCFTYERRGPDDALPAPPPRWPSTHVAQRSRAIQRIWQNLVGAEHEAGLPETRPPDPGFSAHLYEWVRGDELGTILDDDLAAGDFVRNVKQCIDLLRQVADVATNPTTRAAAGEAAEACLHGIVAAAGAVVA